MRGHSPLPIFVPGSLCTPPPRMLHGRVKTTPKPWFLLIASLLLVREMTRQILQYRNNSILSCLDAVLLSGWRGLPDFGVDTPP